MHTRSEWGHGNKYLAAHEAGMTHDTPLTICTAGKKVIINTKSVTLSSPIEKIKSSIPIIALILFGATTGKHAQPRQGGEMKISMAFDHQEPETMNYEP